MPNWVLTKVVFKGTDEDLQKLYADCGGDGSFSFNTFIPMPEELNIESSSTSTKAALFARFKSGATDTELFIPDSDIIKLSDAVSYFESLQTAQEQEDFLRLGQQILSNLQKYGHADWYTWRVENWGTKWDVDGDTSCLSSPRNGEMSLEIQTAWSFPEEVFTEVAEKYPSISFTGVYADEDMGSNCGKFCGEDGILSITGYTYNLKFACDVWDEDYEQYCEEFGDYEDEEDDDSEELDY